MKKLPTKRVDLYFFRIIRDEIHPYLHKACMIRWYKHNGKSISKSDSTVVLPNYGIFPELKKCWDFDDVTLTLLNPILFKAMCNASCRAWLGKLIKTQAKKYIVKIVKNIGME